MWRTKGACKDADPETFHPIGTERSRSYWRQVSRAKRYCRACPVRDQCLDYGLSHPEATGIYGGLTDEARDRIRESLEGILPLSQPDGR